MGVIDALEKRGLRVPQDIALVSFDDLPNASRLFPFLTVVAQPVYDMGVNAAQLLLSQLTSEVPLRPRHVVLPVRLVIRHSCGSQLRKNGECPLSLPIPQKDGGGNTMVQPLSPEEQRVLSASIGGITTAVSHGLRRLSDFDKSDVNRLVAALQHQETDRVPHLEFWVSSRPVYEYVLEHELEDDVTIPSAGGFRVTPEDQVEFALRLGMDAVPCDFSWQPRRGDPGDLEPAPSLASQLSHLERYLRATQGTGVGVIARFSSFFGPALAAAGIQDARQGFHDNQDRLLRLMDSLLARQERVMRAVCDRFASDLALVMVTEDVANSEGLRLVPDLFQAVFSHRLVRLVAAAKDHSKLLLMHSRGNLAQLLPILYGLGFDAVHPVEPEHNNIYRVRKAWAGKLALLGNLPISLLVEGSSLEIEAKVREYCTGLAPGGGYVLSSSGDITPEVPPANFVAMSGAVRRFGWYGSLGREM
jgi:hypothetical protein